MTVRELIDVLKTMSSEREVLRETEEDYLPISSVFVEGDKIVLGE